MLSTDIVKLPLNVFYRIFASSSASTLYAGILPKNSSVIFAGKTIPVTYKNFFTLLPEMGFPIYLVLIAFSGYIIGSASQSGLTVFWSVIVVLVMFIPTALDLRYVDEGIGLISVLSILIPTGFCAVAGFFGYVLHKEGEIYDGANNNKSL